MNGEVIKGSVGKKSSSPVVVGDSNTTIREEMLVQIKADITQMRSRVDGLEKSMAKLAYDYILLSISLVIMFLIRKEPKNLDESDFVRKIKRVKGLDKVAVKFNDDLETFAWKCNELVVDRNRTSHPRELDDRMNKAIEMLDDNPTLAIAMQFERKFLSLWHSDLRALIPRLQDHAVAAGVDSTQEASEVDGGR